MNEAQAKEDCERALNFGLPLAEAILKQRGEFLPFGAAMRPDGEIVCLGAYDGRDQRLATATRTDMIEALKEALIAGVRRQEYIATALFYDARITVPDNPEPKDAVAASLEHRAGYAVVVLLPYKVDGGRVTFEQARAQAAQAEIFRMD